MFFMRSPYSPLKQVLQYVIGTMTAISTEKTNGRICRYWCLVCVHFEEEQRWNVGGMQTTPDSPRILTDCLTPAYPVSFSIYPPFKKALTQHACHERRLKGANM